MPPKGWEAVTAAFAPTAAHAVQALRQSTALIELLIATGVVTKEEVDAQMRSTQELADNLLASTYQMQQRLDDEDASPGNEHPNG